ncbi:UNVERIFIED_CONTAM: RWD domain-containing protein, partial [Bacteroidetes bacterium 56_B9]
GEKPIILRARPPSNGYPYTPPILSIEAELPAHVRLSILKKVLVAANEEFLGAQMLFNIVDWLEQNVPGIIIDPGRLSD